MNERMKKLRTSIYRPGPLFTTAGDKSGEEPFGKRRVESENENEEKVSS